MLEAVFRPIVIIGTNYTLSVSFLSSLALPPCPCFSFSLFCILYLSTCISIYGHGHKNSSGQVLFLFGIVYTTALGFCFYPRGFGSAVISRCSCKLLHLLTKASHLFCCEGADLFKDARNPGVLLCSSSSTFLHACCKAL